MQILSIKIVFHILDYGILLGIIVISLYAIYLSIQIKDFWKMQWQMCLLDGRSHLIVKKC